MSVSAPEGAEPGSEGIVESCSSAGDCEPPSRKPRYTRSWKTLAAVRPTALEAIALDRSVYAKSV